MVVMGTQGNKIKRTIVDGKRVLLLEGPPQILSWNEFKSICKLFEEIDWFDINEVTGAELNCHIQVAESTHRLQRLAAEHNLSKETLNCLNKAGVKTVEQLREFKEDDVSHMKVPMGQKRKLADLITRLLVEAGRSPLTWAGSLRNKPGSSKINSNLDGALAEHPKFWADHMNNAKLIKML